MEVTWPMIAAACLTLGVINLGIGMAQPPRAARLLFFLSCASAALFAGQELTLMRVERVAEVWPLLRWMDVTCGVIVVSIAAFIWVFFRTGNRWLGLAVPGLYAAALVFDFLPGSQLTYRSITGIRTVETFGGATYNVVEGVPNPWNALAYLSAVTLLVFVVDASVRLWRRGEHRRAAVVGGAATLTTLLASVHSALVDAGLVRTPYLISWAYLTLLVAMGAELNADVSRAAKLAGRLLETERQVQLAGEAGSVGLWTWDVVRDEVWATSKARSLFGLPDSGTLSLAHFVNALHQDSRVPFRDAITRSLSGEGDYELEFRVQLPEGPIRWIGARGLLERDARGKPVLMRGAVLDLSARRRAEMELQQLRGQLAHAGRVSMMGQLASALAHELTQPLGAILRNAEAAELFLAREPPDLDELRAILVDIRNDDQRAGEVIVRLRAMLKRRPIDPRALRVSELLASVVALTRGDAAARHITLESKIAAGVPAVSGDRVHLQQVLLNLVLNAMDATEGAPTQRRHVSLLARRNGAQTVEVAVSDGGLGIAPEKLGQVFEPFFTTKENGLGIGLPISRTIIEAHGGHIWAENNSEGGATFRFTLPVAEEEAA
ncbi:MAG TPA: ATP-binding protein [Anaeromyxobacteraceae bacterium]|nr:ATP-binding protein [Anaeromyxobacteraceae bacterium]